MMVSAITPAFASTPQKPIKKPAPIVQKAMQKKTIKPVAVKQVPSTKKPLKAVAVKKVPVSPVKEFTMTVQNWKFSPSVITVKKGDKVRLHITSIDIEHGFDLKEFNINVVLEPGVSQVVEFMASKKGTFHFRCSVPCGAGHRDMKGTIIVQ